MFFSLDLTNELARQTPDGLATEKLKKESTVFSTVGNYVSGFYPHNPEVDLPNDAGRIAWIRWLIAEGYGERLLVAQDICFRHRLSTYGGHGYHCA